MNDAQTSRCDEVSEASAATFAVPAAMAEFLACIPAVLYRCGPPPSYPTVFVSDNVLAQLGYEPEEFYADPFFWTKQLHPSDRPRILAALESIGSDSLISYEYRFRRSDGEYTWLHDRVCVLRDGSARIVGLAGSWFDVSERKRLELLQTGQAQILDHLIRRRSLGETLESIVRMLEDQNPEMLCSILRYDPATQTLHHGAAPSLSDEYNRLVDGLPIGAAAGSCGTAAFRRERVVVTDTQTDPLWAKYRDVAAKFGLRACWSQPIFSSSNQLLGTAAIYYRKPRGPTPAELTLIESAAGLAALAIERYHDEEVLRHAERLASLGTLAAGIAHEINNPVGGILLAAEAAMNALSTDNTQRVRELLESIVTNTDRCTRIIRGVLQFGRRGKGEKQPVSLAEVVRSACQLTQGHASERRATVDLSGLEPDDVLFGDAVELVQVFVNVISNAIESKDKGAHVTIRSSSDRDFIKITVADDGKGMTADQTARIFDPFYTTRQDEGGTGLGMSIVHGIVAAHGGSIRVSSKPQKGTSVVLCLPRPAQTRASER